MQWGHDENRNRTKPNHSGQRAICQLCNGILIAKCGEIYVRHWQHHHDRECDPWQEHETDWHRKWKAKFPDDWQEVIIENEGEKHIADVKTSNGLVIEFQNSSISTSTIRIRENFYEDMIWVVNAKTFKSNFKIRSVVTSRLRRIDEDASYELESLQDAYKEDLNSVTDAIEKNKRERTEKFNSIRHGEGNVEKLNQLLQDHETFTKTVIDKWSQNEFYWDYQTNDITNKIESEIKNQLQGIPRDIKKLQADLKINEQSLLDILKLENFQVADIPFKIVQYEQIPSKSFQRARAISKLSRKTFFPEVIEFKSESEFHSYQYRKEQYDFAVDPTNAVNFYTQKIEDGKKKVESLEQSLLLVQKTTADQLVKELKDKIRETENNIEVLNNELDELIKQSSRLDERQAKIISMRDKETSESAVEIERKKNDNRLKVMREKKGLYTFDWKHKRKSWDVVSAPLFFDIGEEYLFEKIGNGLFKKILIMDFLKKYSNHHYEEQERGF